MPILERQAGQPQLPKRLRAASWFCRKVPDLLEQRASTIYYVGAFADPTEAVLAVGHRILITDQGSAASGAS